MDKQCVVFSDNMLGRKVERQWQLGARRQRVATWKVVSKHFHPILQLSLNFAR